MKQYNKSKTHFDLSYPHLCGQIRQPTNLEVGKCRPVTGELKAGKSSSLYSHNTIEIHVVSLSLQSSFIFKLLNYSDRFFIPNFLLLLSSSISFSVIVSFSLHPYPLNSVSLQIWG
ncbi:hypothetical protein L6452_17029 [Arctium lappa]|uniref:Uncharacterized protein n=1 Tax=Arctium lappa TaxID=4217 RepID=A0ACB9C2F8_ARCLA|nr:hypothetical protein L6452_17029 [Arctium lappa]